MTTSQKSTLSQIFKILLPITLIILVILAALQVIKSELNQSSRPRDSVAITVGNVLPDFTLTRMDGTQMKASELNAKVLFVNFWASWCEACMDEMPSLVKLRAAYHAKGLEIIGINVDENPNAIVPGILKQFDIQFPVFKDTENTVADLFDVHAIPLSVVLNEQRKILYVKDGEQDWNSPQFHSEIKRWLEQ